MGKSNPKRSEQAWTVTGKVGTKGKNLPKDLGRNGDPVGWERVVYASEMRPCTDCGEPFCDVCEAHYADCACVGPDQASDLGYDLAIYDGKLYYRR